MKLSLKKGFSFGLTSGVITTLGLMVGLNSGTHSKAVVMGDIITIAIADSMSDALGIHISEEAENVHSNREVWESTFSTFLTKFIFALSFVVPVIFLPLQLAVSVSVIYGLLVLAIISYKMARSRKVNPLHVISEHLFIAMVVILLTYFVGNLIGKIFI